MNHKPLKKAAHLLAATILGVSLASAGDLKPHRTGPRDKCPVCGMFVAKYPDFAAQIQFRDGTIFHFDGAKDMFKFYLNLPRYAPGKKPADITAVLVTDYYNLDMVDGQTAFYVAGSDVYGPMGRELVPFAKESKARDFLKDHRGKSALRFGEVTAEALRKLD
jgi:copper chaperone NosL